MASKYAKKLALLLAVTLVGSSAMITGCSNSTKESGGANTAIATPAAINTPVVTATVEPTNTPIVTAEPSSTPDTKQDTTASNTDTYKKGILTDTTFESEFLGIRYTKEGNYNLASQEELDASIQTGLDVAYGEDGKKYYDYANATLVMELLVSTSTGSPNLNINVQNLGTTSITSEQYAELAKQQFNNTNMNYEIEDEITQETFVGETYYVIHLTNNIQGIKLIQKVYFRNKADRMITITLSYMPGQEDAANDLMGQFKPYGSEL